MSNIRWAEPELPGETDGPACSHCGRLLPRPQVHWNAEAGTWYCLDSLACYAYMYEKSTHQRVFNDRIWEQAYCHPIKYLLRRLMFWRWREVTIVSYARVPQGTFEQYIFKMLVRK